MSVKRKIQFDIITIFPDIFDCYFNESIIRRAQQKKLVKINVHNLRDFTTDKHKTVDDRPFGGGPGMVLKIEPIYKAVKKIFFPHPILPPPRGRGKIKKGVGVSKVILLSPSGKKFDQKMAQRFSKLEQLIFICGRYEGVDERVAKYIADEEVSVGDYILTGGEIPAMIIVDAVSRLIPGVLGKEESIEAKRGGGYPVYTRPENFRGWKTPKVLLSGDHKRIEEWRKKHLKNHEL